MVFFQPEQRAADQKTSHLVPAVIEDGGAPVRMEALARIGMLIEMRAIEKTQTMTIGREMGGHPIEYDADPMPMEFIDEIHEILRGSIIARWGKVSGRLVAP